MAKTNPETRARYAHFLTITTRWMDNDVYNHVNNVNYYSYFDTVVNEYMLREGVLALGEGPVCLVVETGCQYFSPISFPDQVHCIFKRCSRRTVNKPHDVFIRPQPE